MTLHLLLALVFNGVLLTACVYALGWGGRPEQIGAAVNLVASGATTTLRLIDAHYFATAEVAVLSIDLAVAGAFYWLAVATSRFWPIWAFGFALADILISVAGGLLPKTPLFAYHTGLGIYAYLALAALVIGSRGAHRARCRTITRSRRDEADDWRRPRKARPPVDPPMTEAQGHLPRTAGESLV